MHQDICRIAEVIRSSSRMICFTGAGISTESGIPDFRSEDGLWKTSQPVLFDDFISSKSARMEYWSQKSALHQQMRQAVPNITHEGLAAWEEQGMVQGIITQNIDGLHQAAGSRNVLELHGTALEIGCLDCSFRIQADELIEQFQRDGLIPDCPECGGILKHCTTSFGQLLDQSVIETAADWVSHCDMLLVLGSSLVVEPAASLPVLAHNHGSRLVIINRDQTPLDRMADIILQAELATVMSQLISMISS